jgi:hypothetical protein
VHGDRKLHPRIERGERKKNHEIDVPANIFGKLLGELFIYRADIWEGTLRAMGEALGRFIYMMDAYDDFPSDEKKGNYNPLLALMGDNFEGIDGRHLRCSSPSVRRNLKNCRLCRTWKFCGTILYSGAGPSTRAYARTRRRAEGRNEMICGIRIRCSA